MRGRGSKGRGRGGSGSEGQGAVASSSHQLPKSKRKRLPKEYRGNSDSASSAPEEESEGGENTSEVDSPAASPNRERPHALIRKELYARKVVVPKAMWPDEQCSDGEGWPGKVVGISRDQATAKVMVDDYTYAFPMSEVLKWRRL